MVVIGLIKQAMGGQKAALNRPVESIVEGTASGVATAACLA